MIIRGEEAQTTFDQLQASVAGELTLTKGDNGWVSYTVNNPDAELSDNAKQLTNAIDDHSVQVQVTANTDAKLESGKPILGGAFLGASTIESKNGGEITIAQQQINTDQAATIDNYYDKPGATALHEITEAYQGAKLVQQRGSNSGPASSRNSVYPAAHSSATKPAGPIVDRFYDANGRQIPYGPNVRSVEFFLESPSKPPLLL